MQKRAAVLSVVSLIGTPTWAASDGTPDLAIEVSSATTIPAVTSGSFTTSSGTVTDTIGQSSPTLVPAPAMVVPPQAPPVVDTPLPPPVTPTQAPGDADEFGPGNVVGTVQSVDRNGRSFVLQDSSGRNIRVSLAKGTRFFRHGQQVDFRDIELNDLIAVRSSS